MKFQLYSLFFLAVFAIDAQDYSKPENTFSTLLSAIETEDLALYKECWAPEQLEKEGMYSRINANPKQWAELKAIFNGPQEISNEDFNDNEDGSWYKAHIIAPEGNGGGIGTISMKLIDGQWKMYRW